MENIFLLKKSYTQDILNFNTWFESEIKNLKSVKMNPAVNFETLNLIRLSPGLVDTIEFMNDIYDKLDMAVDYIGLFCIKPNTITPPLNSKYRTKFFNPTVDKIFDNSIPDRKCKLHIPITSNTNLKMLSLDPTDIVTDENRFQGTFKVVKIDDVPHGPFLFSPLGNIKYNNKDNNDYIVYVEIGFQNNPDFEVVKGKFKSL
jgi:hypothetical protein